MRYLDPHAIKWPVGLLMEAESHVLKTIKNQKNILDRIFWLSKKPNGWNKKSKLMNFENNKIKNRAVNQKDWTMNQKSGYLL
jgi:hypothetical protein